VAVLTPGELLDMDDGYYWRQQRAMERVAWQVRHIYAAMGAGDDTPTVDELLGRVPEDAGAPMSDEQKLDALCANIERQRQARQKES
jgi:hypothetical protein